MASSTTEWIDETTKTRMQSFFKTLSEKDQRRYAAVEAQRLGHGGITYVAGILGCSCQWRFRTRPFWRRRLGWSAAQRGGEVADAGGEFADVWLW